MVNIKINYHPMGQEKEHSNLIKEHLKKRGITQTWLAKELGMSFSITNAYVCNRKLYATADTPNVGDNDGDMSETKLTGRQQKILNLIKESPTIAGKQMSEILSVSQRTIERDISALQKIGVLKREGKDNDGLWIIVNY